MLAIIKMKRASEELILNTNRTGEHMESAVDMTRFWMQLSDEGGGIRARFRCEEKKLVAQWKVHCSLE